MKTVGGFEGQKRFSASIGLAKRTDAERGKTAAARLEALRSRLAAAGKLKDLDIRSLIDERRL
ncbi:MAG: hypothetical protein ACP5O6_06845 [Candidatus Baltobacteraceae bacterium]